MSNEVKEAVPAASSLIAEVVDAPAAKVQPSICVDYIPKRQAAALELAAATFKPQGMSEFFKHSVGLNLAFIGKSQPTKEVVSVENVTRQKRNITQPEIEMLNRNHALVLVGGKVRVIYETINPVYECPDIILQTTSHFKELYGNHFVEVEGKSKGLGQFWLEHPDRRQYEQIVFLPGVETDRYYNLWRGYAVEPRKGSFRRYIKHVFKNIARRDKAVFKYLIAWMADTVQNPGRLNGVCIVLQGKQGTGKGVYISQFGKLFGTHYKQVSQSKHLIGNFNSHMKDCVVLYADEVTWGGDRQAEGVLKALITEPTLQIEGKGQDIITVQNNVHLMISSNNDWIIPAGLEERRFFTISVGEEHMKDREYFAAIEREMDKGGREALLHYLLNFNLKGIDLGIFPQTAALFEQKMHTASADKRFWYSRLESGNLSSSKSGWDIEIPKKELYGDFVRFCNDIGARHKPSDVDFGTILIKMVPGISAGRGLASRFGKIRPNVYKVPSLKDCREAFCKLVNYEVPWPVYEDEPVVTTVLVAAPVSESAEQD